MTVLLGLGCLSVILLSIRDRQAGPWALLLGMTWLGGFSDPWLFPVVNVVGMWFGVALIKAQKLSFESYGGLVTVIFPLMLAFDVGYKVGMGYSVDGIQVAYYYGLLALFVAQLVAVGSHVVGSAASWMWPAPPKDDDLSGFSRVLWGETCRSMT